MYLHVHYMQDFVTVVRLVTVLCELTCSCDFEFVCNILLVLPGNLSLGSTPVEETEVATTSTGMVAINCPYALTTHLWNGLSCWSFDYDPSLMAGLCLTFPPLSSSSCGVPCNFAVKPANAMFVLPPFMPCHQ